jgi:hypothetical protein
MGKMAKQNLFIIGFLFLSISVYSADKPAREELLVVQTVSKDRRSFVMAKGLKDGITRGEEMIYANDFVSILCKAREVNRNYSLWVPIDPNITIPFNKDEIISYNSHAFGNVALDIVGDVSNITPTINYDEVYKKFRTSNNFSAKASLNRGLSQSSSDVSSDNNSTRTGYSFSAEFNYRFMPTFEMSFGGRLDREVYRLNSVGLDIPTNRHMATVAATYHLLDFTKNQNNFYLSVAAGIGKSTTTVSGDNSSGLVTLLPEVRIGYLMPFSKSAALLFEGSIESLSAREKFASTVEQVTNIINVKLTFGLRF